MNIKEKIKAEIERRRKESIDKGEQTFHDAEIIRRAVISDCNDLLSFIDSLPEETSEDLEQAATEYANKDCVVFATRKKSFNAGAKWKEEQMMKKAVEWLKAHANDYILNCTESYPDAPFKAIIGGKCWEDFTKAMED